MKKIYWLKKSEDLLLIYQNKMTINSLEIVKKIGGNKKAIDFFLKNLNINHDANIWMINGSKGIGKSFLVKLIASSLLTIEYKDNEYENIFHPDLVFLIFLLMLLRLTNLYKKLAQMCQNY